MQKEDPKRYQRFMDLEDFTQRFIEQKRISPRSHGGLHVIIPVVVHVLHNGEPIGTGLNISMAQIQSQLDVLNEDFRRQNADANNTPNQFVPVAADAGIEFQLACVSPDGDPTLGVVRRQTNEAVFIRETDNIKFDNQGGSDAWPAD